MPQPLAEELNSIPMSSNLGQSLERAHRFARDQSHRAVTLEHLLLALAEDPEAALILESANVELSRLSTEVSAYLGGLLEDMRAEPGIEPRPDGELLRVLKAAASAAQQSRRRQIDGAIVLAAIVGDGKSPAAGMLKALGMTFEEAIRALQRANTKARLQPSPKATAPGRANAPDELPAGDEASTGAPAAPAPVTGSEPPPAAQSAEEILAAARARIQLRAAAAARPEASAKTPAAPAAEGPAMPAAPKDPAGGESLSSAIEAAMATPTVRRIQPGPRAPAPLPPLEPSPPSARPARTAPSEAQSQAGPPLPQPPAGRAPTPLAAKPLPGDGPPRPPPPPRPGAGPQPPPGFSNRPSRAPWPELGERGAGLPGPLAIGERVDLRYPSNGGAAPVLRPPQPPRTPRPLRPAGERGPLVESIPRRMRTGTPASGEVRIARDRIELLMQALSGGSPHRSGTHVARALSVRLRAPTGGFAIEAVTPETQWIDGAAGLVQEDAAAWRWIIVPQRRGRGRLLLTVSARTIGADALVAESAPPDRVIDVRVRANMARTGVRLFAWIASIATAALLGRYGEQAWITELLASIRQALGG